MNWSLFLNSLLVAGLTTLLAGGLGGAAALALATMGRRWRQMALLFGIVALAWPPFLITNTWIDLLGNNGIWRRWLPVSIYSLGGVVALLTFQLWPLATLFTLGAWSRLKPEQIEADPALRGGALLRWVLWPMARGAMGQAAVLTFVLALNNFAVPVILQVPVFPEELWLAFTTRLSDAGAWAAAWPMVAASLVVLRLLRHAQVVWPAVERDASAREWRRRLGPAWHRGCTALTLVLFALSVAVPAGQLTWSARTWAELPNLLRAAPDVAWNSFEFAAAAASVSVAFGFASWRGRFGLWLWLPLFIPGVLLGRTLIALFNGTPVYGTAALVVAAFALRYVAIGWHGVARAMRAADRDLIDAARLAGASGWTLLGKVLWPQIAPQAAAAWYVTYLLCLWDVETLVLIYPPGGETLALRIFNLLHYGHNAQVNAMCVVLLALAVLPLGLWTLWRWLAGPRQDR